MKIKFLLLALIALPALAGLLVQEQERDVNFPLHGGDKYQEIWLNGGGADLFVKFTTGTNAWRYHFQANGNKIQKPDIEVLDAGVWVKK